MNKIYNSDIFKYTSKFKGREVPLYKRLAHALRAIFLLPVLIIEWPALLGYRRSHSTKALMLLNDITNSTHGRGLEIVNKIICLLRSRQTYIFDKLRPDLITPSGRKIIDDQINELVDVIRVQGFARIPSFLTATSALDLYEGALQLPGFGNDPQKNYISQLEWAEDPMGGPRFNVDSNSLAGLQNLELIRINPVLTQISRKYLGCPPICASVQIWTTRPPLFISRKILDDSAMAFHCDSDYFGFLKFFLLLTEVKPNNGPFTFVRGSHRGKRHVAGRMEDTEIISDRDEVLFGTGEPGDLIIADTKGWHKATPPEHGMRTMLQVLYTTSLFGQSS